MICIPQETTIFGELCSKGSIRVDGRIKGDGKIEGDVFAKKKLEVNKSAEISGGKLYSPKMHIAGGAKIDSKVNVSREVDVIEISNTKRSFKNTLDNSESIFNLIGTEKQMA